MNSAGMKLICISGGIGSGKSVVSRILRCMGHEVFDCDCEAKKIMDTDTGIHRRLCEEIHSGAVQDGIVRRDIISSVVFSDSCKLERLNGIVHSAVKAELLTRIERHKAICPGMPMFVETAILYQSGLNELVDAEWEVSAPESVRVERVMARNGLSREQVLARIASQLFIPASTARRPEKSIIVNDGVSAILPRIVTLLGEI